MRHKFLIFVVVVLIAVILVEGIYLLIQASQNNNTSQMRNPVKQISRLPTPPASQNAPQYENFEKILMKKAQATSTIFIGADCTLSPVVAQNPNALSIKIINEDSSPHTIRTEQGYEKTIDPQKPQSMDLRELPKQKPVSLFCDADKKVAGYLIVPNKIIPVSTDAPEDTQN